MSEEKMIRLSQVAREFKVGIGTITEILAEKGFVVENQPNSKITHAQLEMLAGEFGVSVNNLNLSASKKFNEEPNVISSPQVAVEVVEVTPVVEEVVNKVQNSPEIKTEPSELNETDSLKSIESFEKVEITAKLPGLKVVDKIDLNAKKSNPKIETAPSTDFEEEVIKPKEKEEVVINQVVDIKEEVISPKIDTIQQPETISEVVEKVEENSIQEIEPVNPEVLNNFTTETITPEISISEETIVVHNEKKEEVLEDEVESDDEEVEEITGEDESVEVNEPQVIKAKAETLKGLNILGKIELPVDKKIGKPVASSDDQDRKKRKRKKKKVKRVDQVEVPAGEQKPNNNANSNQNQNSQNSNNNKGNNQQNNQNRNNQNTQQGNNNQKTNQNQTQNQGNNRPNNQNNNDRNNSNNRQRERDKKKGNKAVVEISDKQIQDQIKQTLAQLSNKGKGKVKRKSFRKDRDGEEIEDIDDSKLLRVTEFISANDLATLMEVSVNEVIKACISLGMFVSINQRLDAEAIQFIGAEFGYDVEFISAEEAQEFEEEDVDNPNDLEPRAPIVTVMGHVDHGKTSLLDYIRRSNVVSGESGGITQHIGAYEVTTDDNKRIVFLDTPGHEAFTAMRARGARLTDVVILVVAADDSVMPQTKEAINHARVAGVPIVIAINKIDKPTANSNKIREELSKENILVESWGGKYQDQEISAKTGLGIEELLDKVLLEAELLELTANPNKKAIGTVIEASLDKGRGYVSNILIQAGTMKIGDVILVGSHYGRVKAMYDHLGKRIQIAGPSTPVQVLGLDGAPQAGDTLKVMNSEREAREIAAKREQILREQNIRATKGLTLEEIGRRKALGTFKELRLIVKGDVDGSVEALSDSLLKLSTPEIEIKIIHKGVGAITETDVMLAKASEAIILGFQVRPSSNAKKSAEQEKVQIKIYSIIYNAIEEIKDAMEGLLAPTVEEVIVGNAEVREVFKISRIGTVAGCMVTDGFIKRTNKIRLIRDGIVTYEGEISALKRFKEDVGEVRSGFECGMSIRNFNDIKIGDVIECFELKEVKRTL
jgi:translation initiation factor IF-2